MMRPFFFVLLLCHSWAVWAGPPQFSKGGVLIGVQLGAGLWGLDGANLSAQLDAQCFGCAGRYVGDAQNAPTLGLRLGYNILGHASVELNIVALGWNLGNASRGGAGFATGVIAWHPLQLIFMKKEQRPFPFDASMLFGVGYGIAGQSHAMDGVVLQWGLNASWWFTRFLGLGVFVKGTFLKWNNFYLDFDRRDLPGATLSLRNGSGGAFWMPGIELLLRIGD